MLSVCMCVARNNAVLPSALSGAGHQVRDLSLVPPVQCAMLVEGATREKKGHEG